MLICLNKNRKCEDKEEYKQNNIDKIQGKRSKIKIYVY
jgi:hypothetical protein